MAKYRTALPQLTGEWFLTDGGLETTLVFHEGIELPAFAAFPLLRDERGRETLLAYYRRYADIALRFNTGFILESPSWRANPDWGTRLGFSNHALRNLNAQSIRLFDEIVGELEKGGSTAVISGCVGPRGDGYRPTDIMSPDEAQRYHADQVNVFHDAGADLTSAITMTYPAEAIGIARAAREVDLPVVISFTVETDGRLPTGQTLAAAIDEVDRATDGYVAYYMINCAHPSHFAGKLEGDQPWAGRIRGIRANASTLSHAELDEAEELDDGDPAALGQDYVMLRDRLPNVNVMGGCCGTDHRHVEEIAKACGPML